MTKFFSDLLILRPSMCKWPTHRRSAQARCHSCGLLQRVAMRGRAARVPVCKKKLTHCCVPQYASLCASWFSWCGKARSTPPQLMSTAPPRTSLHMTLHSMCQPGRPLPQGEAHDGSPSLLRFHSTKSEVHRFSLASAASAPSPSIARATSSSAVLFSFP